MANYFLAYHNHGDTVVIDDTYVNLSLSRKIAVSSLPVATISESAGYTVKGSLQVREIPQFTGDESVVAVGGYTNFLGSKDCPHFILNCLKKEGQEYKIKRFVCAADVISGEYDHLRWDLPIYRESYTVQTGLSSDYAPSELYIYIFAKTPNQDYMDSEKCGLQIFNANRETVFDSRYKYFNAKQVGFWGHGHFESMNNVSQYAIANVEPRISFKDTWFYEGSATAKYTVCIASGHVLIGRGWQGRSSYPTDHPIVGIGARTILKQPGEIGVNTEIGTGDGYILIDVSGF